MEILYILIPLGLLVQGVAIWGFLWAVKTGQFDDMEGPAHRILMDDDDVRIPTRKPDKATDKQQAESPPNSQPKA